MTASKSQRHERHVRYASKPATKRVAKTAVTQETAKLRPRATAKAKAQRARLAAAKRKRSKPVKSAVTVLTSQPIGAGARDCCQGTPASPMPVDNDFRVVTVARCR